VINKKYNSVKVYKSKWTAAKDLIVNYSTFWWYYVNKDKLLKGTYLITSISNIYKKKGYHI
jgi:hypothetical protein